MGKLSSKLNKMKIRLIKLHKKTLKYYRLNLFKEIATGFNHGLLTTLQSPASFFDSLLVNAADIIAFSSSLVLHEVLFVSHSTIPHIQ